MDLNLIKNNKNSIIIGSVFLLFLAGIAYFIFGDFLRTNSNFSKPSLERELKNLDSLPKEVRSTLLFNVSKLQTTIREDETNVGAWLDLAIQYKIANDYEGAVEIWEYLTARYPNEEVAFHNLGNFYAIEIKDYEKAEGYYKKALETNPLGAYIYLALHEMYRYSYKTDTTLAEDVLKTGIEKIPAPHNTDLLIALASYYKSAKKVEEARRYYDQAIRELERQGNQIKVDALRLELRTL